MAMLNCRITVPLCFLMQLFHAADLLGYCPTGWLKLSQKCYVILPGEKNVNNQLSAERICRLHGGTLMNVYTVELNNMATVLMSRRSTETAFIALNDKGKEGDFRWSDGTSPVFFNWGKLFETELYEPGPLKWSDKEDCVCITRGGTWHDISCEITKNFRDAACEKPIKEMIMVTPKRREKHCGD